MGHTKFDSRCKEKPECSNTVPASDVHSPVMPGCVLTLVRGYCHVIITIVRVSFFANLLLYVCRPGYCLIAPELVAMYRQAALLPRTCMGFLFQLKVNKDIPS